MNELFNNKIKPGLIWFAKSFIWLGLLMLIIDIVTKNVVIANRDAILSSSEHGIILIPNFLAINYVIKTGAAFGYPQVIQRRDTSLIVWSTLLSRF